MKTIIDELDKLVYSGKENPIEISFDITNFFKIIGKVRDELQYADKCHNLEEELGCPLEVYVKLHRQMKFYRLNALNEIIECEIDNPNDDEVYHIQVDGIIFNQYDYGWQFYPFKDYKKTWWLKEDRSE